MKVQDRVVHALSLFMSIILLVLVVGIIILTLEGKEIPPVLVNLTTTIGGAFVGYFGALATAY